MDENRGHWGDYEIGMWSRVIWLRTGFSAVQSGSGQGSVWCSRRIERVSCSAVWFRTRFSAVQSSGSGLGSEQCSHLVEEGSVQYNRLVQHRVQRGAFVWLRTGFSAVQSSGWGGFRAVQSSGSGQGSEQCSHLVQDRVQPNAVIWFMRVPCNAVIYLSTEFSAVQCSHLVQDRVQRSDVWFRIGLNTVQSSGSVLGSMVSSAEHCNKTTSSTECGNLLRYLSD